MEPADPPPKKYDLKPREFKRDNLPAGAEPPALTAKDLAIISGQRAPAAPLPGDRLRPATAGTNPGPAAAGNRAPGMVQPPPKPGDPNDVHVVLQQNRAAEQRMGVGEVEIKKVRSRRKRDYWLLLVPSVLLLSAITWQNRGNPFFLVCGVAGIVILTLSLTWIMWHVMDHY